MIIACSRINGIDSKSIIITTNVESLTFNHGRKYDKEQKVKVLMARHLASQAAAEDRSIALAPAIKNFVAFANVSKTKSSTHTTYTTFCATSNPRQRTIFPSIVCNRCRKSRRSSPSLTCAPRWPPRRCPRRPSRSASPGAKSVAFCVGEGM